jgi:hypothetical protein
MRGILCWRVEDDTSIACHRHRRGIYAGRGVPITCDARSEDERQELAYWLDLHLDWSNRIRTPFISVYKNWKSAKKEADRRADAGKSNVVVYEIFVPDRPPVPVDFRQVRKLSTTLGVDIPPQAEHNSEHEFVFLNHIPEVYISRL